MKQRHQGNRPSSPGQSQTQNPMQPNPSEVSRDEQLEEQEEEESGSRQEEDEESTSIGKEHSPQQKSQYPSGGSRDT